MDTNRYKLRRRQYALTDQQRSAIDLILGGANDRQVAERLAVSRVTFTRWRNYDPQFQLALNNRRTQLWAEGTDAIRTVLPEALDTIREQLRISPNRGRLALDLVVRAGLLGQPYSGAIATAGVGPLTMDDLLDQEVLRHRAATGQPSTQQDGSPIPISEEDRDAAYERLMDRLNAPLPEDGSDETAAPAGPVAVPAPPAQPAPIIAAPTSPPAPPEPDHNAPVTTSTTRRMSAFS